MHNGRLRGCDRMIIEEGTTIKDKLRFNGGTAYIYLPDAIKNFLGITEDEEKNKEKEPIIINIKFENGKHGRYISIWKSREDDENGQKSIMEEEMESVPLS